MVRRYIRIVQARVRFSLSPQNFAIKKPPDGFFGLTGASLPELCSTSDFPGVIADTPVLVLAFEPFSIAGHLQLVRRFPSTKVGTTPYLSLAATLVYLLIWWHKTRRSTALRTNLVSLIVPGLAKILTEI